MLRGEGFIIEAWKTPSQSCLGIFRGGVNSSQWASTANNGSIFCSKVTSQRKIILVPESRFTQELQLWKGRRGLGVDSRELLQAFLLKRLRILEFFFENNGRESFADEALGCRFTG